jgi:hypothetical protein
MMSGSSICPVCLGDEEEEIELVKNYLKENPHSTPNEIFEATGVSRVKVIEFIKRGRILNPNFWVIYSCELCGEPIREGRVCGNCRARLRRELQTISKKKSLFKKEEEEGEEKNFSTFIPALREKYRRRDRFF